MDRYELKLEAPWNEVKEMLQEINMDLTDEDLYYERGKETGLDQAFQIRFPFFLPFPISYLLLYQGLTNGYKQT